MRGKFIILISFIRINLKHNELHTQLKNILKTTIKSKESTRRKIAKVNETKIKK